MTVSKMEMDGSMPPAVPALMMASTRQLSMRTWAAMAALTLQTPLYRAAAGTLEIHPSWIVSMACRRTERLSRRGRNGASSSSPAHRIPILGSTSHPSSLQSSCGYGGIVTRNVWERNQRLHRIMLYGII